MKLFDWDHKTFRRNALLVLALVSVAIVVHEVTGRNGYLTLRHQKKEYTTLQKQIHKLSQDNQQLEQKIKALKDNPQAIEKQARDQLQLVKPGEMVYMLPARKSEKSSSSAQQAAPKQSKPKH